ncbi:hypothetical protein JTB14_019943 [Gonioctena quinquepunctata]|nr:hypothetical protein JTB14_019943 [Gonioctena quinquepunctata]
MDPRQFREFGKAAVDYIADYFETMRERPVMHSVHPGYLEELLPKEAPRKGEPWENVLRDVDKLIQPGLTHWHHPNFHGYFAAANSFPAIVGEMMSAGFTSIGVNWMASPAYTELEMVMMDWLARLLNLPEAFLNSSDGPGGGVLQGSASESTLLCLLTSRERKIQELQAEQPDLKAEEILGKLVAYSSDQSNSSIERAGLLGSMPMRLLPSDSCGKLRGSTLLEAMREDKQKGLIPCYVVACLGTTPTCAMDDLSELGPICEDEKVWLHVDAAYAGAALACPEYRHIMRGIEFVDSFNFNPHKWMLVNYDCSAMWLRDARHMIDSFNVDRIYLKHNKLPDIPEYRHWQIPLGRRLRAMKLWFVLRIYGIEGIQKYIRGHVAQAKYFERLVRTDSRFEVVTSILGLVCFRLQDDSSTQKLLDKLVERENIFLIAANFNEKRVIRFAICSRLSEKRDMDFAWKEILTVADGIVPRRKREITCVELTEENICFSDNLKIKQRILCESEEIPDFL